jgi:hypothetical protein
MICNVRYKKKIKEVIKTITNQKHTRSDRNVVLEKMVNDMEDENIERRQSKNREIDRYLERIKELEEITIQDTLERHRVDIQKNKAPE